jgi:DNA-binding NtrC family response regulator
MPETSVTDKRDESTTVASPQGRLPGLDAVRRFRLVTVDGADAGKTWASDGDRCSIGSHPSNDLVLKDSTVSRFHCEIRVEVRGARVRDLDSMNGTLVDGTSVLECWLRGGSLVRVGRTTLRFELAADSNRLPVSERTRFGSLVGHSVAMRTLFAMLERAAASDATVLLEGETGTGKQGAAEAIHRESTRRAGAFITVDCGGLPENLLESELFGHEKGAFTGATGRRIGAFEEASGGTLFLDEIGEMPQDLQPKLLRALEQREVRRVGTNQYVPIDVRVIAATNRDLRAEVNAGRFRSDLYFRLAVVKIGLPPLRHRPEDVPALVESILDVLAPPAEARDRLLDPQFIANLVHAAWPGNVRELKNYVQRCLVFEDALPVHQDAQPPAGGLQVDARLSWADGRAKILADFERSYIEALLRLHGGKVAQAAAAAKMDRVYLYKLIRKHGLASRR